MSKQLQVQHLYFCFIPAPPAVCVQAANRAVGGRLQEAMHSSLTSHIPAAGMG